MRELTAEEREIVAGGRIWVYETEDGLEEVSVRGRRSAWADMPFFYFYNPGGPASANGGGGTADSDDTPDVRDVNCVVAKPDVTDLKDIFQKAVDLHKAEQKTVRPGMEWGALMYTLNGDPSRVYATKLIGGMAPDHIPIDEWERAASMLPAGAVIVATWHSHPPTLGGGGHLPSDYRGDWGFHTNLLSGKIGDYPVLLKVDPNALMLITDKFTQRTWVYDRTDYNSFGGVASGSKACDVNRRD